MPKSNNSIKFSHAKHKLKVLGLAGLLATSALKTNANENDNFASEITTETVTTKKQPAKTPKSPWEKVYKINNRADFNKLWNDAKPFCVPVLIASENWRSDWHNDRQKTNAVPNSVGVGLFSFPANRDFSSSNWIQTRTYYTRYKAKYKRAPKKLTPQEIRDGIYGWCDKKSEGSAATALFNVLRGTELTINEFAAIYSHYYHTGNLNAARKIVEIKKNKKIKDKPLACAQALLDTDPIKLNGRTSRFMHEALIFLNTDNYCADLFCLCVDCNLGTSINACPGQFYTVSGGKLTHARAKVIKDKICNYTVKNGIQIKKLCSSINDKTIMAFCVETQSTKQLDERDAIYQKALDAYNKQNYKTAKKLFIQVMDKHGEGPELWNDMAITYYNLNEYDKCIEMARKVLNSEQRSEYAKACYNAGKAYEAKGNNAKALQNYESALKFYKQHGIAHRDTSVNYETIYTKSINRVKPKVTPTKTTPTTPVKKGGTKSRKSGIFFLASMAVTNKNRRTFDKRANIIKRTRTK